MVNMTKRQILQRVFLRFLMKNKFYKQTFVEIWSIFIDKKVSLNNDENFEVIYSFFKKTLEQEYFIMDIESVPPKYTSKYNLYQLKKICLPEDLQGPYESIYEKTNQLKKALRGNEIEIEYLNECSKEFPIIGLQIDFLMHEKKDNQFTLQSQIRVLKELIQTF